jgi:YaiO family outer membrane protein
MTRAHPRAACIAAALLALALVASPARAQVEATAKRAAGDRYSWVGLDYAYTDFRGALDAWHTAALSLGRHADAGSIIGRVTWADRFAQHGVQVEADAYPRLGALGYAYLNVGYSGASIFPAWRFGAEAYRSLPGAWEASLGVRELRFTGAPVTLFTGSIGKYAGNEWISLRPWVREKDGGLSASGTLSARLYGATADDWIGARVGYGSTPSDDITPAEVQRLKDTSVSLQGSRTFASTVGATLSLTWEREEILAGRHRTRWELSGGLSRRFR